MVYKLIFHSQVCKPTPLCCSHENSLQFWREVLLMYISHLDLQFILESSFHLELIFIYDMRCEKKFNSVFFHLDFQLTQHHLLKTWSFTFFPQKYLIYPTSYIENMNFFSLHFSGTSVINGMNFIILYTFCGTFGQFIWLCQCHTVLV